MLVITRSNNKRDTQSEAMFRILVKARVKQYQTTDLRAKYKKRAITLEKPLTFALFIARNWLSPSLTMYVLRT